jgi:DNA-binding LytR/AlgR family response regulator
MPGMNGMELAAEIRSKDTVAKIIFLTSSAEFAVKSYSVGAFHYLLKPVQKNELFSVLEKACYDICYNLKEYIMVKTKNELFKVFFNTLIYVEVIGKVIYFYQKNGLVVVCTNSISQVEEKLLIDKRFIKPHRSYIVNMDYIKTLARDGFITLNDQFIPVSRNVYKEVKQTYFEYLA